MLPELGPITQTLLGTLFTWGLTAAGAGLVVFIQGKQVSYKLLFVVAFSLREDLSVRTSLT